MTDVLVLTHLFYGKLLILYSKAFVAVFHARHSYCVTDLSNIPRQGFFLPHFDELQDRDSILEHNYIHISYMVNNHLKVH